MSRSSASRQRLAASALISLVVAGSCRPGSTDRLAAPQLPPSHAVMAAVIRYLRWEAPHGVMPIVVSPTTTAYDPAVFTVPEEQRVAELVAIMARLADSLQPVQADTIAGAPVRHARTFADFEVTQSLVVRFTSVGFSDDSSLAVVGLILDCGPACGSVNLAVLSRRGRWQWGVDRVRLVRNPRLRGG